jgi:hypothetical protein
VLARLAVVTGLKLPQTLEPQLADQVAPAAVLSLVNCTVSCAVLPAMIDVGGVPRKAIVIAAGVIVSVTVLIADGSLVTDAVMVTLVPRGTAGGAV